MLDLGDVLKLDQSQLETVIPVSYCFYGTSYLVLMLEQQIGGKVKIVNGGYRGETAVLQNLDVDNFCATVKLTTGPTSGKVLSAMAYEDICKIHV